MIVDLAPDVPAGARGHHPHRPPQPAARPLRRRRRGLQQGGQRLRPGPRRDRRHPHHARRAGPLLQRADRQAGQGLRRGLGAPAHRRQVGLGPAGRGRGARPGAWRSTAPRQDLADSLGVIGRVEALLSRGGGLDAAPLARDGWINADAIENGTMRARGRIAERADDLAAPRLPRRPPRRAGAAAPGARRRSRPASTRCRRTPDEVERHARRMRAPGGPGREGRLPARHADRRGRGLGGRHRGLAERAPLRARCRRRPGGPSSPPSCASIATSSPATTSRCAPCARRSRQARDAVGGTRPGGRRRRPAPRVPGAAGAGAGPGPPAAPVLAPAEAEELSRGEALLARLDQTDAAAERLKERFAEAAVRRAATVGEWLAAERAGLVGAAGVAGHRLRRGRGHHRPHRLPLLQRRARPVLPAGAQGRRRHRRRGLVAQAGAGRQDPAALAAEGRRARRPSTATSSGCCGRSTSAGLAPRRRLLGLALAVALAPAVAARRRAGQRLPLLPRPRPAGRRRRRRRRRRTRRIPRPPPAAPGPEGLRGVAAALRGRGPRATAARSRRRCRSSSSERAPLRRRALRAGHRRSRGAGAGRARGRPSPASRSSSRATRTTRSSRPTPCSAWPSSTTRRPTTTSAWPPSSSARRPGGPSPRGASRPPEPMKSYAPSIALYQRLITGFPDYQFTHGIHYLLAYCLGEMGQGQEAQAAYQALIERFPASPYVPEAWVRLGDWYFDEVEANSLLQAADAFSKMYAYPEHPLYARAIYKLGWTYYRMDDYQQAVDSFTRLLDFYVARAGQAGREARRRRLARGHPVHRHQLRRRARGAAWRRPGPSSPALGGRPYEAEVFTRLGDVYFDETKYAAGGGGLPGGAGARPALARRAAHPGQDRAGLVARPPLRPRGGGARRRWCDAYAEGTPWWETEQGRPRPGRLGARPLREEPDSAPPASTTPRPSSTRPRGKLEEAVAEYRLAAKAYGDYLARFPHSKQAHELTYNHADCLYNALDFEQAARVYAAVRDDPADDKYLAEAAVSAVISWEGEVTRLQRAGAAPERKVLLSTDRKERSERRAEPLPDGLPEPGARLRRLPGPARRAPSRRPPWPTRPARSSTSTATSTRRAAASRRWWARWPDHRRGPVRGQPDHRELPDHEGLGGGGGGLGPPAVGRRWPRTRPSTPRLQKFKLGGRFNRAMQLMEAKQCEPAAALFLALVAEEPRHEFADKALYNAASCYEGGPPLRDARSGSTSASASSTRSRSLADEALFRVGFNAENTYDFEKAVDRYLAAGGAVPEVQAPQGRALQRRPLAGEPAALRRRRPPPSRATPRPTRTPRTPPAPSSTPPSSTRRPRTGGRRSRRSRSSTSASPGPRSTSCWSSRSSRSRWRWRELKDEKAARAGYARHAGRVRRAAASSRRPAPRAAAAAAEARFRLAEFEFEKYDAITLPATTDPKKLKRALEAKFAEAKRVAPLYDEVGKLQAARLDPGRLLPQGLPAGAAGPDHLRGAGRRPSSRRRGTRSTWPPTRTAWPSSPSPTRTRPSRSTSQAIEAARKLHVKNEWTKKIGESLARYRPARVPGPQGGQGRA